MQKSCTMFFLSLYIKFYLEMHHITEVQWVANAYHVDFKPAAVV